MKRILVVEDDAAHAYLIKLLLVKGGYEVLEARTGIQGFEMASEQSPDLILIDSSLPDINGLECAKRLRDSEAACKTPIVMLTSFARPGDEERALSAGCTGFIEKPSDLAGFVAEMEKYL